MAGPCNKPGFPSCKEEYEKMVLLQGDFERKKEAVINSFKRSTSGLNVESEKYKNLKLKKDAQLERYEKSSQQPLSDSYVDALLAASDEFLAGGKFEGRIVPGDVYGATRKETNKRYDYIKSTNAYKKFVQNPNAGPIIKKFKKEFEVLDGKRKGFPAEYQIPNEKELRGINKLADKYADSEDINKDLTLVDKIQAGIQGFKLGRKYPNLYNVANKKFKFK